MGHAVQAPRLSRLSSILGRRARTPSPARPPARRARSAPARRARSRRMAPARYAVAAREAARLRGVRPGPAASAATRMCGERPPAPGPGSDVSAPRPPAPLSAASRRLALRPPWPPGAPGWPEWARPGICQTPCHCLHRAPWGSAVLGDNGRRSRTDSTEAWLGTLSLGPAD